MVAMSVVELTGDNFMKSRTVVFFSVFIMLFFLEGLLQKAGFSICAG